MTNKYNSRIIWFIILFTIFFTGFRMMQHYTFNNNALDDGFNDNLIWNTIHGKFMYSDIKGSSTLGDHLELATLLFIPFYLLGLGPFILFFGQTLLIGLGALPIYWQARDSLGESPFVWLMPLAYLLYLPTVNITFQGYYPIALCITPLLFATYYLLRGRYLPFLLWLGLAMLCQENIYLVAAFFGLYILGFKKEKLAGGLLFISGLALFILAISVIIPHFNTGGSYVYYERYAYLGNSLPAMVMTIAARPLYVLAHVITPEKIWFIVGLFLPVAFLSFRRPALLIPALPIFAINLLSSYRDMYQLGTRYPSAIVPFVFMTAILGLATVQPGEIRRMGRIKTTMVLFMVLSTLYFFAGFYWRYTVITEPVKEGHQLLRQVPADAAISALGNLYPHLSHREKIWLFPKNWEKSDYLILCKLDPTWPIEGDYTTALTQLIKKKNYGKLLEYIFVGETPLTGPLSKTDYAPLYEKIRADRHFTMVTEKESYILLKRTRE
ncbi:MAG: DUF2079 domain-containing protein [Candidatus Margulisbacteria bacterium]|nr:DUF2079 domain-containing protein [Candidatus Margulisiibacteriota bacterium]MBU1616592.1 DUF2079 domain-containing protein [Candidatus Margulisiibacteriota bacterium]